MMKYLGRLYLSFVPEGLTKTILQAQVEPMGGKGERKPVSIQPDAPINFLQLSKLDSLMGAGDMLDISLSKALGTGRANASDFASSKLNKVITNTTKKRFN